MHFVCAQMLQLCAVPIKVATVIKLIAGVVLSALHKFVPSLNIHRRVTADTVRSH